MFLLKEPCIHSNTHFETRTANLGDAHWAKLIATWGCTQVPWNWGIPPLTVWIRTETGIPVSEESSSINSFH